MARILQVIPALDTGGAERGAVDLANYLVSRGHHAFIASAGGQLVQGLSEDVYRKTLPLNSKNPINVIQSARALHNFVSQRSIDLVHIRSRLPGWAYKISGARVPWLTTYHGVYSANGSLKKWYNSIMAQGHRVIAPSRFVAEHIKANYPWAQPNIRLVYRGVDLNIFNPAAIDLQKMKTFRYKWRIKEGERVILLPGRISAIKGQRFVLDAIRALRFDNLRLVFLGSGNNEAALEQVIANHQYSDKIVLSPATPDIAEAYGVADVILTTTQKPESFGRSTVEAMAMGGIVLGANHGGTAEIITDSKDGYLFEPNNAHDFCRALKQVLQMPSELLAEVSISAKERAQKFSQQNFLSNTLEVYEELL